MRNWSDTSLSATLFLAASVWGLYWVPLFWLERIGLSGAWAVAYFNAVPLILFVPILIWRNGLGGLKIDRRILLIAFFAGMGMTLYAIGIIVSSVIRGTLLFYLTPIWSTLIGVFWLSERLSFGRIAAIILGILGVFCLLWQADDGAIPLNIGDLLGLLSGVSWAIGAACLKKWPDTPILLTTVVQLAIISVVATGFAVFLFGTPIPALAAFTRGFPVAFIASGLILVPSILIIFAIAQRLFPGRVGVLMMSEVLVAILSAALLLPQEWLTPVQWLGALGIIAAAFVEVMFASSDTAPPAASENPRKPANPA